MMSIEEYAEKLGVKIECHEGNFYVSLRDYEKLLERLQEYVDSRLRDVELSLEDRRIGAGEKEFLEGQKDELLAIKRAFLS